MKLARTIRFDESDLNIFPRTAEEREWALVGTFTFQNLQKTDLIGKTRQAFSNGFLGVDSFGYSTFVTVAEAKEADYEHIKAALVDLFINEMGAPNTEAAGEAANEEIAFMADLCAQHSKGSLLAIHREWGEDGIGETFRHFPKPESCSEQKIWAIVEDQDGDEDVI